MGRQAHKFFLRKQTRNAETKNSSKSPADRSRAIYLFLLGFISHFCNMQIIMVLPHTVVNKYLLMISSLAVISVGTGKENRWIYSVVILAGGKVGEEI